MKLPTKPQALSTLIAGAITTTNYFGRNIQNFLESLSDNAVPAVYLTALAALILPALYLVRHQPKKLVPAILVTALLVLLNEHYTMFSVEKIHIPLYGALSFSLLCWLPVSKALIVASIFGALEEYAQKYVPERFFDTRDIFLNLSGVGFGFLIWLLSNNPEKN